MIDLLDTVATLLAVLVGVGAGLFIVAATVYAIVECLPSRIARDDGLDWSEEWE